jgi:phage gpG-like protein
VASKGFDIGTEGLRDFRRYLRKLEPELDKQLAKESKAIIGRVAAEAKGNAPFLTGALGRSYRPFVTTRGAGIRSRLPYAGVHEYGGKISPRGTPIEIRRSLPITRAVEHNTDRIVDGFGDAVEQAADAAGWH